MLVVSANGVKERYIMIINSEYCSKANYYRNKITENFSVCLVSLLFLADLCFQSFPYIIIYAGLVVVSLLFNAWQDIKLSNLRTFNISYFEIWFFSFNILLFAYGYLSLYNADRTQYSLLNHLLTVAAMASVARHLQLASCKIKQYLRKITLMAIPLLSFFVIAMEWSMLADKIPLIIKGISWYRLGNKNNWNPNSIALHMSMLSILLNYVMIYECDKKLKCVEIVDLIIAGGTILLTGSKKGIVLLFLPLLVFPLAISNNKKKVRNLVLSIGAAIGGIYLVFNNEFLYHLLGQRIIDMLGTLGVHMNQAYSYSASTADRADMVKVGMNYFAQNPIFGNGWGYFYSNAGFGRYSHNNYVEILCSMGLIGFMAYYWYPIYVMIKSVINANKSENLICVLIIIMVFFIDTAAVSCYNSMVVSVMLCVATIINHNLTKE